MKLDRILVTLLVLLHMPVTYLHGEAHTTLDVILSTFQNAFVYLVIVAMPVVGMILLWTKRFHTLGLGIVVIGMIGALLFGVFHHYMLTSPDHISHLPAGEVHVHETFIWTAGANAMLEGLGAMVAAYFLGVRLKQRHANA